MGEEEKFECSACKKCKLVHCRGTGCAMWNEWFRLWYPICCAVIRGDLSPKVLSETNPKPYISEGRPYDL